MLVNGAIKPFVEVPRGKVRFRLLNGSNARLFNFFLSDKSYFWQIASDGGLLEKPIKQKQLALSPGERAEIVVDFSQYSPGDFIFLKSGRFKLVRFVVGKNTKESASIPDQLTTIKDLSKSDTRMPTCPIRFNWIPMFAFLLMRFSPTVVGYRAWHSTQLSSAAAVCSMVSPAK